MTPRTIVDEVLGKPMTKEIWSASYDKILPVSLQTFDISAMLPAVFYMFRFGYRRGAGKFQKTFGSAESSKSTQRRNRAATIERVVNRLVSEDSSFIGFNEDSERAILGDMLLSFNLENTSRASGRTEPVARVFPSHYMASWIDLPDSVAHLRHVPEMIVALLANQNGQKITLSEKEDKTEFSVGHGYENNVLLLPFRKGVEQKGTLIGDRSADKFNEKEDVGLDQLLMIRIAEQLGRAPERLRGDEESQISNQLPIAERASSLFSEHLRRFVVGYASVIPRSSFIEMLESCIAIGLTTIISSVFEISIKWFEEGTIPCKEEQKPFPIFVDCSNGVNTQLRNLAEESMDEFVRRIERFPMLLMILRILDYTASHDYRLKPLLGKMKSQPYATELINFLGELYHSRRAEADMLKYSIDTKTMELAERIEEDCPNEAQMLKNCSLNENPVYRLAEALISLQSSKQKKYLMPMIVAVHE